LYLSIDTTLIAWMVLILSEGGSSPSMSHPGCTASLGSR
jgi:hypothetical protein